MTFGTKLRKLREERHLSQQQVADSIGVGQNTYSRWESDLSTFKIEYLTKIANVFKIEPIELVSSDTNFSVVNNTNNKDSSINGFNVYLDMKDIYKDLLDSKDEIIRILKEENGRLKKD
jgi:transcriptional regulator with XRE-family HTH domain